MLKIHWSREYQTIINMVFPPKITHIETPGVNVSKRTVLHVYHSCALGVQGKLESSWLTVNTYVKPPLHPSLAGA